ncbi:hypothetical protein LTR85_003073 [Meristemomyces frigidus]|nr:hypothetical protein LTR85_003073 [Meristemomyces frigidus]
MPRNGDGSSDNVVEAGENLIHGAGAGENDAPTSSGVDRSSKAAPPPSTEKGEALEGMGASGGGASGPTLSGSGKGDKEAFVDKEAERLMKS